MGNFRIEKPKLSLCLNILSTLILITGLIFLLVGVPTKSSTTTTHYKYNVRRNATPTYTLKEDSGNYYDNLVSETGVYPSLAIERMSLNMNYIFEGDHESTIDYTYNVDASIIGDFPNDGSTSTIWSKKYVLVNDTTKKLSEVKNFNINEKIDIDYQMYNNLVRTYKETFGLNIDAYLRVRLNVKYNSVLTSDSSRRVNKSDFIEVKIPLNDYISEVKKNYQDITKDSISDTTQHKADYTMLYIGVIFIIIAIILYFVASNKKEVTKLTKYKKNMARVMREYGDLIVTVTNKPSIKHLQVMGIATIDDLVDVADQNKCHIIRYEILKKSESFLLVINGSYVYVYVVSDADLKFAK